jgi:threonine synthase
LRYCKEVERWSPCISLETADPAKFPQEVSMMTGLQPPLPPAMADLESKEEQYDSLDNSYEELKAYLLRIRPS